MFRHCPRSVAVAVLAIDARQLPSAWEGFTPVRVPITEPAFKVKLKGLGIRLAPGLFYRLGQTQCNWETFI